MGALYVVEGVMMEAGMDDAEHLLARAWRARRDSHLDVAYADLDKAIVMTRSAGDEGLLAKALMQQAQVERDRARPNSAVPLYEEAVRLFRQLGDPLALASAVRHLGDTHAERGDFDEAMPCYDEALAIYRAVDDPPALALANALRPMALLHEAQGSANVALPLWREAFELYDAAGIDAGVEECGVHLAALALPYSPSQ
jgi:tetratricopeptide (TPR) repeat protein